MLELTKRQFLGSVLGMAGSAALAKSVRAASTGLVEKRYRAAIVIDGAGSPEGREAELVPWTADKVAELRQSGLTGWQVTVGDVGPDPEAWDRSIANIAHYDRLIELNPDIFCLARSAADIRKAKADGRSALIYATQNTQLLGSDLDRLEILHGLGVRVVQLTYNLRNFSGDGALEPANAGLSNFGRKAIERIEGLKIVLDLAHGGAQTIIEAIAAAKRPPLISHSGCRALADHSRNVSDEALKALANKGGVFGVYFMPYLTPTYEPTREDVIAHLAHAVNVAGEDHVALGTDGGLKGMVIDDAARAQSRKSFAERSAAGIAAPGEGPNFFPVVQDYNTPTRFLSLSEDLARRGWSMTRIEKILGGNLLRAYGEAWGA